MPKMKTHKATVKRVKVTGSGKIVHKRAGFSHLPRKVRADFPGADDYYAHRAILPRTAGA